MVNLACPRIGNVTVYLHKEEHDYIKLKTDWVGDIQLYHH